MNRREHHDEADALRSNRGKQLKKMISAGSGEFQGVVAQFLDHFRGPLQEAGRQDEPSDAGDEFVQAPNEAISSKSDREKQRHEL
jgi:hypothetical protein